MEVLNVHNEYCDWILGRLFEICFFFSWLQWKLCKKFFYLPFLRLFRVEENLRLIFFFINQMRFFWPCEVVTKTVTSKSKFPLNYDITFMQIFEKIYSKFKQEAQSQCNIFRQGGRERVFPIYNIWFHKRNPFVREKVVIGDLDGRICQC